MTRETMSQQPSILSTVPTLGPLHISLNSREHIVNSFHPFFKSVYQSIFPNSKLADKPKPWRVSLILEIVYGGWTLIRQTVMQKLCKFKDPQYGTLLNLLDNYIPLVLSIYSISFKLNHFWSTSVLSSESGLCSLAFKDVITIRHLLFGSTCVYTGESIHSILINCSKITLLSMMNIQLKIHTVFCERKQSPQTLLMNYAKKAKAIFQSKEKQSNFRSFFTSPKQFSFSHNQLQFLKVKCAKVLTDMLKKNCTGPGRGFFFYVQRQENWSCNISHHVFQHISQDHHSVSWIPLWYQAWQQQKMWLTRVQNESWSILTGCFHSFHCKCLDESTSCPLFKDFLKKKVQELGEIAKEAILHPHATDTDGHNEWTTASMTDSKGDEENHGVREMEKEEYENLVEKLNNELSNLSPPPQPCIASRVNQRLSQNTSCNSTAPRALPHCSKCHHPVRGHKRENNSVTTCNFCPSNTCTSSSISTQCSCHRHQQHQRQQANQQPTNQHQPVLPVTAAKAPIQQVQFVTVIANQNNDVTEWLLPNYLSQSTIGGRMTGSNACTVIALLTGRHFLEGALAIPKELKDLSQTIPFYSKMTF